jgi:DNA adenine methylase
MSAAATPLRSPVTWFGGKGHLARRIVALLPRHECYVEPCVGAGAVFWWKPGAPLETLNDLAGDVVHFYRVLRDPAAFERFSRLAALTLYAREEFEDCRRACHDDEDPVARAWAWFVSVRQAFGSATGAAAGEATRTGWRYSVGAGMSMGTAGGAGSWGYSATNANGTRVSSAVRKYLGAVERLPEIHQRLQGVQIECGDWRRVLAAYGHADALAYIDPPYVRETRRGDKRYAHEFTLADHHELTAALLASPAMVALSGYRHDAVHRPLEEAGWERTDIDMPISVARHREGLRRIESIWRNPAAVEAWKRARAQPSLFEGLDR